MGAKERGQVLRVPCNTCKTKTKHAVLFELEDTDSTVQGEYLWRIRHLVLQCMGCDTVTLCTDQYDAPWVHAENDEHDRYIFYPPRVARHMPSWVEQNRLWRAHPQLNSLMWEVYRALSADSRRLAMMGVRTLLDLVIQEKVGDQGNFDAGLNELVKAGVAGANSVRHLKAAVEAGHAAAHRAHEPTIEQLNQAMDIVENIIHSAFVLEQVSEELAKNIPRRPPRK